MALGFLALGCVSLLIAAYLGAYLPAERKFGHSGRDRADARKDVGCDHRAPPQQATHGRV